MTDKLKTEEENDALKEHLRMSSALDVFFNDLKSYWDKNDLLASSPKPNKP